MAKNAFVEPYALGNCINQVMIINFKFVHARFGRWLVNCMPQHGCVMLCASRYSVWRYGIVKSPVWWVKSCCFSTVFFKYHYHVANPGWVCWYWHIFFQKTCFDTIRPSQRMPKTTKKGKGSKIDQRWPCRGFKAMEEDRHSKIANVGWSMLKSLKLNSMVYSSKLISWWWRWREKSLNLQSTIP